MKLKEWLIEKYQSFGIGLEANQRAYALFEQAIDEGIIPEDYQVDVYRRICRATRQYLINQGMYTGEEDDQIVIEHNKSLFKRNQKLIDLSNLHNKEKREIARKDNLLIELNNNLITLLKEHSSEMKTIDHKEDSEYYGIIHLSDMHFNELIRPTTSISNKYDFSVASARLYKLASESKRIFNSYGIKKVLIAITGDSLNSDRRLGEILSMATNRSKATLLSCYLLRQFILEINNNYNVTVASVCGNESRVGNDLTYEEIIASDNYDYMIDRILRIMFENKDGISFIDGSYNEKVVGVSNKNILLLHGHTLKHSSIDREIYSKVAKYSGLDIKVDYVLYGHLHQAMVSDLYARSSSLCGDNAYSSEGLNLVGKASQNIFVVSDDSIHGMKIDLQNTGKGSFYINKELEEYNAKSAEKLHDNEVIVKVII
jgi:predicted phosphodiesterase